MFKVIINQNNLKESTICTDIPYLQNPDFLCIIGSHLYGTANENSDIDIRGFSFLPKEYLLGIKKFEQHENLTDKDDIVVWSVNKYVRMLLNGSTVAFEMLFCPNNKIIRCSELACKLLLYKQYYVSQKTVQCILGYAKNEWRNTLGIITRDLGEKRKEHIKEKGYSYKNAYHAIRILDIGKDLAKYGLITFPCNGYEFLKAVKNGDVDFKDVENIYNQLLSDLESLKDSMSKEQRVEDINNLLVSLNLKNILFSPNV